MEKLSLPINAVRKLNAQQLHALCIWLLDGEHKARETHKLPEEDWVLLAAYVKSAAEPQAPWLAQKSKSSVQIVPFFAETETGDIGLYDPRMPQVGAVLLRAYGKTHRLSQKLVEKLTSPVVVDGKRYPAPEEEYKRSTTLFEAYIVWLIRRNAEWKMGIAMLVDTVCRYTAQNGWYTWSKQRGPETISPDDVSFDL